MSAAVADPSGRPPAVADQCDPRTTIVFEPTETLMIQRWDKRRQKNLFVARPEASGDFDQREIDRWLLDAPSNEPPPEWRPRPSEPAPDPGVRSLMPPDWPTHRSEVAYETWSTIGGDTVHRIKRHGPGAAPPGVDVAPSKPPPSPIRLTARGDLVSGDRLRLTTAEDTARAHLRDHHIPISTHEFIVRRRPRERPTTAPATRGAATTSSAVRLTHGRAPGVGWRGPHFAAPSRDPTTGLPASATSLEDAADPSRRRYGVAADIRERAGSACQETSRASGPPDASAPASARSTFRRKEAPKYTDAASFHASQRATARATGRWDASTAIRPATARPAATTTTTTTTARLTPGEGRGGGGLPTAAPGSATAARAARRASARAGSHFGGRTTTVLSRPATATARGKKTVAFPDTREGRERVAAAAAGAGTDEPRVGDEDGDGFGAQERVSMEAHMERLRSLGASLNPRQRTMVGRGMEKARERIRHERSWGG